MDLTFTEEQLAWRRKGAEFALKYILPGAKERDREGKFDLDLWRKMGEEGFLGLTLPKEYGGQGMDAITASMVAEGMGLGGDTGLALSWGAHMTIGTGPIVHFGTKEQKEKYIPKLASGEWIAAFGLTEPNAGSDVAGIQTTAEKKNGKYILNGTKMFITNAPVAKVIITAAMTDKSKGYMGMSMFIVESDFPGYSCTRSLDKLGVRSSPTGEIVYDNCEVPAENLLGIEGMGFIQAMQTLDRERGLMTAGGGGAGELALSRVMEYAKRTKRYGKPLIEYDSVREKIADIRVTLEAVRLMGWYNSWTADQGIPARVEAAIGKLFISEATVRMAINVQQIFGGYGILNDLPIERGLREARLGPVGGGTSEIQRWLIGRLSLGL